VKQLLVIAAALTAAASAARAAPVHRYSVAVEPALERLAVTACFSGPAPARLAAESSAAEIYLETMQVRDAPAAQVNVNGGEMTLTQAPDNACLEYRVRLQPSVGGGQTGGPETRRIGRDLLTSIGDWLWQPVSAGLGEEIELDFKLPPGIAVSAPWPRAAGTRERYRIGRSPVEWPGVVAFGSFPVQRVALPGATLELAIIDQHAQARRDEIARWIEGAARGVASAYGRFPVEHVQVLVAATPRGRATVPWAYVARGGGPAVHFFINGDRSLRDFELDWTATHEMSHLYLPYLVTRDAWLSEGMATYLQNVLMARAGTIPAEEAWRRLYSGFKRGEATARGLTITQASEQLGRPGTYLRMYWAGAALMLEADLRLRARGSSLDAALAGLAGCCAPAAGRLRAEQVLREMDRATVTTVFAEVYRELFDKSEFPDFEAMFRTLGIDVFGIELTFSPDAERKALRDAIMAPR
jgi:hypothetical protein